jgi:2-hydroxyglutarate dehydrogenase
MKSSSSVYFDHIILGGGIVGLAIASRLAASSSSVLLLERKPSLLQETSSHNSGVVHAGLYYPKDSLKTKLCIEGNKWIWENSQHFRARKCGKWIIACSQEELKKLNSLQQALQDRGMPFRWVSKKERQEKEPELECIECLESSNTGIIDVHSLANFFTSSCGENSVILPNTEPKEFRIGENKGGRKKVLQLVLNDQDESVVETNCLINSTGLFASKIAQRIRQEAASLSPDSFPERMKQKLVRGSYVSLSGKPMLSRLVYPCPLENLAGLGVHSVIDTIDPLSSASSEASSQLLFGPNVEFLSEQEQELILKNDSSRYQLSAASTNEEFLDSVHRAVKIYLPRLDRKKLHPAFCGIRPKLSGQGESFRDFLVEVDSDIQKVTNGEIQVVNCLGIESPGLTSSSAIGRYIVDEILTK